MSVGDLAGSINSYIYLIIKIIGWGLIVASIISLILTFRAMRDDSKSTFPWPLVALGSLIGGIIILSIELPKVENGVVNKENCEIIAGAEVCI